MKFVDTNYLLNNISELTEPFYVSSVTLEEIENIKTSHNKDEEVKAKARSVSRYLYNNRDKYKVIIHDYIQYVGVDKPDYRICSDATKVADCEFMTMDLNCSLIAKYIFGLNVPIVGDISKELYKGYKEVCMDDNEMATFYSNPTKNLYDLYINEYLLVKDVNGELKDIQKWTGAEMVSVKAKPFKSNMFGTLKPLDAIQTCAMDSIANNDITVLYGKAGSGKTTLPLNYIMQGLEKGKFSKCYIVYSYEPLKNAKVLGFEKGTHEDKLLMSASIGNILSSKFGDIDQVRYMLEHGQIDIIPTANIRGVEFASDTVCYVTESQNLDIYTLKTIIQRCKAGCKQIYEGDIVEQKDINITNIGMNRLIDVFKGNDKFGCIKLKNNYRSELSELADLL